MGTRVQLPAVAVPDPRAAPPAVARSGVVVDDLVTGALHWSSSAALLLGLPPGEPVSRASLVRALEPGCARRLRRLRSALRRAGGPDELPVEVVLRDGGVVDGVAVVERDGRGRGLRVSCSLTAGGAPPAAVGADHDREVAVQEVGEVAVQEVGTEDGAASRFSALLSVVQVAVALLDEDGLVVDGNAALADLVGHPVAGLRGRDLTWLVAPEDRAARAAAVQRRRTERSARVVAERVLLRADGVRVHVELHQSLVLEDGRRRWLTAVHDISEQRRSEAERIRAARTDALTGLANRAAAMDALAELLAAGSGAPAVLLCDVDRFKRVNDSLGHALGDHLLVLLADRLRRRLPEGCLPARLSGDEFAVVCEDVTAHGGVENLGRRVVELLRTTVSLGGQDVRVSASLGAAVAGHGSSPTDLLRYADAAMVEAKRAGSGRVVVAGDLLRRSATQQVQLEAELRTALSGREGTGAGLTLHYQPVVRGDGLVVSAEALVRWNHPTLGTVLPHQLLAVAEQGDLLVDLDLWALRTASREAVGWAEPVPVAVNLSGIDPGTPHFVAAVRDAVAPSGLSWDRLVLELVETRLVDLSARAADAMRELSAEGVRFAVDDFGTGHSSLARLKELPVQVLKVDRSFVAGVGRDPSDFALVRAVVDLARALGRTCVAEGVETTAQFQVLRGMGVDSYQGWLFARALPPEQLRALLAGPARLDVTGAGGGASTPGA